MRIDVLQDATMVHSDTVATKYWRNLDDGRIECTLCPRACKLREGQRGLCFVRACEDKQIVLKTYGRSSGFCIDPIEKKPLNHFLPGTPVLSFGTAGCNLACKFCQNWDISKSRQVDTLSDYASPQMLASAAKQTGCRSIAFTYNDPVIFLEYAIDIAKACRKENINSVAVSAGYICPEPRIEFFQHMDAANIDLKAFTEQFYYKLTGAHLEPVLDTLRYIKHETDCWLEITTLLIPDENDGDQELHELAEFVAAELGPDTPLHFTAFHPDWKMRDKTRTPANTLLNARQIALEKGLHYVYTGNIHDRESGSTYCHHCRTELIGRDWHQLLHWHLDEAGSCKECGTPLAGVFENQPGKWGAKRQVVKFKQH